MDVVLELIQCLGMCGDSFKWLTNLHKQQCRLINVNFILINNFFIDKT